MQIKKIIPAVLCALVIAAAVSCGSPKNENSLDNIQTPEMTKEAKEQNTIDADYMYGGEKLDFGGETFIVLYPEEWSLYIDYYFAEEENGDAVNDALFRRVIDTNDFFNVDIKTRKVGPIQEVEPAVSREVMSGTNSFDIALTHCISGLDSMVSKNIVYNWAKMPNVDFDKKYWNQSMNDYLTINGYTPFVANDFIIPDPCFITFSKDLLREYALEDPYELVKSGRWTWDKLGEMAKKVSKDLDGDGLFTDADLYGFVCETNWLMINAMYACDQFVLKKDDSDRYVLDLNTAKTQSIIDMFYDLVYVGNQTFPYIHTAEWLGGPYIPFDSGRALFYMTIPRQVKELRATEFDFGILPYPKFDEKQENYITLNWAGTICAPANISNPEKVGALTEYLGAKSHEIVMPAYFDILLNGKVIRDEESRSMLEIVYGNSIYDFGLNFSNFNELLYAVPFIITAKSTDLTSYYEKRAPAVQKQYDKIYDAYIKNSEIN